VTRANFLIDSESRLKAALAALAKPAPQQPPAPPDKPPAADGPAGDRK